MVNFSKNILVLPSMLTCNISLIHLTTIKFVHISQLKFEPGLVHRIILLATKYVRPGPREMAHNEEHLLLSQRISLVPSIHVRWFKITYNNSSSMESNTL